MEIRSITTFVNLKKSSRPGLDGFARSVFLPLLFSAYPVLALLGYNIGEVRISAAGRALAVVVGSAYATWLILRLILRDWQRAGILCALLFLLFFSYGHIYSFLEKSSLGGISLGRHRLLAPLWLAIAVLLAWWTARKLNNVRAVTTALYLFGVTAMIIPLAQIFSFQIRISAAGAIVASTPGEVASLRYARGPTPPNVYYIILDAYSRVDILKEELNFDNSSFLSELEKMGFTIARCSQSNYAQTELSLASSLNYDYLQSMVSGLHKGDEDRSALWPLLRQSRVRKVFEENGYTTVAFETGYSWSELRDADIFFSSEGRGLTGLDRVKGLTEIEAMLVKTSGALALSDMGASLHGFFSPVLNTPNSRKRERILYTFAKLKSTPLSVKSPKLVFVHIVAPHYPYVFGPKGEEVNYPEKIDQSTYQRAYTDQLAFMNRSVIPVLREILEKSSTPPIIILQADHGHDRAAGESRMKIFNAYYLPDGGSRDLYPTISPVNTFRIIFNYYFGGNFPLLEDISYFSTYRDIYNFQTIMNQPMGCAEGE